MKRLKKIGALAAALTLGVAGLAGCSGGGKAAGTECIGKWVIESMESEGEVVTAEDLEEMSDLGFDMTEAFAIDMHEDGTAELIVFDEGTSGTWEGTGSACDITVEGETLSVPIVDGRLVMDEDGTKIVFKRG